MRIPAFLLLLAAALGTVPASAGSGAMFTEPGNLPSRPTPVDLLRLKEDARRQRNHRLLAGSGFLAVGVGCLAVKTLSAMTVEAALEEWDPEGRSRRSGGASALVPIGIASAAVGAAVMALPWPAELEYIRAKDRIHVSWTPSLTEPAVEIALDF